MNIKVAIFEDNNSLRNGLYQLIDGSSGFECVGSYPDCSNILLHIDTVKPDVVLMDIMLLMFFCFYLFILLLIV